MAYFTATEAAQRFLVKRPTVHMWHTRGWINPEGQRQHLTLAGYNADGARLYDEAELVEAEQHTRSKRQRSHRRSRVLVNA